MNGKRAKKLRRAVYADGSPRARSYKEIPLLREALVPGKGTVTYCKGHLREADDERRIYQDLKRHAARDGE